MRRWRVFVVSLIPFVGGLLVSLLGLFGFGAALLSQYGISTLQPRPRFFLDRRELQMEQQTE